MDAVEMENMPVQQIESAARGIYYAFKNWVEYEDCRQEAWVSYLGSRRHFDQEMRKGHSEYVRKSIRNAVSRYAQKQKALKCGYDIDDQQRYGREKIRLLLEYFLAGERVPVLSTDRDQAGDRATTSGPGMEIETELLDVERAWRLLDQADRDTLWQAYGPADDLAGGDYDSAARGRVFRSLGRMKDILNGASLAGS